MRGIIYGLIFLGLWALFFGIANIRYCTLPISILILFGLTELFYVQIQKAFLPISYGIITILTYAITAFLSLFTTISARSIADYYLVGFLNIGGERISVMFNPPCAGIESIILYAITCTLILPELKIGLGTKIIYTLIGLIGTFLTNAIRILIIFLSGFFFGINGLLLAHSMGHYLFLAWMVLFWYFLLKRSFSTPSTSEIVIEQKRLWDKVWSTWKGSTETFPRRHQLTVFRLISKWISDSPNRLLEIGCGSASFSYLVARNNEVTQIVCFDLSKLAIDVARVRLRNRANFVIGDMHYLPFRNNSFDLIFSEGTIEHTDAIDKVAKEIVKAMKKNGTAIIITPSKFNPHSIIRWIRRRIGTWNLGYEKSYSPWDLVKIFHKAGLRKFETNCGEMYAWLSPLKRIFPESILLEFSSRLESTFPKISKLFGFWACMKGEKI